MILPSPRNFSSLHTHELLAIFYCRDEFISPTMDGEGMLLKLTSRKWPLRCCCNLQSSLHAVRKIKADNLYKTSKLKDHEKWRTQAHHRVAFRASKFNSVPFQFNPPSCRESLLQFNRFLIPELHMPMEAGPTIVCWLILSPMDHSFYAKVDLKILPIRLQSFVIPPRSELGR